MKMNHSAEDDYLYQDLKSTCPYLVNKTINACLEFLRKIVERESFEKFQLLA